MSSKVAEFSLTSQEKIHYFSGKHRPPLRFDLRKLGFVVQCLLPAPGRKFLSHEDRLYILRFNVNRTAENKVLTLTCSGANSFGRKYCVNFIDLPFNLDTFGSPQSL